MPSAREWNTRYTDATYRAAAEPDSFLIECLPFLPPGRALDLACGAGHNAIALAERGWRVTAIDFAGAALDLAEAAAHQRKLSCRRTIASRVPDKFFANAPKLLLVQSDLESFLLPKSAFNVILCLRYLQRSLFPALERALRPAGALIFETFTDEQLPFSTGPRNPQHLLRANELHESFPSLTHLFYREYKCSDAVPPEALASLLARNDALRLPAPP
jgi:SAM-dependent methyltransferase